MATAESLTKTTFCLVSDTDGAVHAVNAAHVVQVVEVEEGEDTFVRVCTSDGKSFLVDRLIEDVVQDLEES